MAKTKHTYEPGPVSLLVEILRGVPALPDAACIGRERLFDPVERGERPADAACRHAASAARLCAVCPALAECRAWATQPDAGAVLAGVIPTPATAPGRRRKNAS